MPTFQSSRSQREWSQYMATDLIIEHFMDTKCSKNQVLEYLECYSKLSSWGSHSDDAFISLSLSSNFRNFVCKLSSVNSLIDPFLVVDSVHKTCSEKWLLSSVVIKLQLLFAHYFLKVRRVTKGKEDQKTGS